MNGIVDKSFPAIIDTGSSTLGVPPKTFDALKAEWVKDLKDKKLDCKSDENFCQVQEPCNSFQKQMKPISFLMSGRVFEVPSNLYLFLAEGKCQFGIYKNDLGGNSVDLFIIGEPLLKNLYTVYDFDQDEIKLGVNIAATSEVLIYEPGKRPSDGKMHVLG